MTDITPERARHRVVGATIVLALLVIVLPFFFSTDQLAFDPRLGSIDALPPAPTVGAPQAPTPMPREAVEALQNAQNLLGPDAPIAENLPLAWGVQAASFSRQANAESQASQMRERGWTGVRVEQAGNLYRVIIGPVLDRDSAEELKGQLKADFNLDGFVMRFQP